MKVEVYECERSGELFTMEEIQGYCKKHNMNLHYSEKVLVQQTKNYPFHTRRYLFREDKSREVDE